MTPTYLVYECQLRAETDAESIQTLLRKGWVEVPQPSYDPATEYCEWENCQWVVKTIVVPVPEQIAFWAFRVQLQSINKFNDVQNLIDNLPPQQNLIINTQWEYGNFLQRTDELTLLIINAGILTSEEMDDIFRAASILSLSV